MQEMRRDTFRHVLEHGHRLIDPAVPGLVCAPGLCRSRPRSTYELKRYRLTFVRFLRDQDSGHAVCFCHAQFDRKPGKYFFRVSTLRQADTQCGFLNAATTGRL